MINGRQFYHVLSNVVPLYVGMILGYVSVKWLNIFTPDQCSGISLFVARFAVPLLSFAFISTNNLYNIQYRFLTADSLQKIVILTILVLWSIFSKRGSIEWCITLFSVAALPSIIVMGVPMLDVMYGHVSDTLLVQTVVLQYLVWFPLLLFLLEFRAAKLSSSSSNKSVVDGHLKSVEVVQICSTSNNGIQVNNAATGADEGHRPVAFLRCSSDPTYKRRPLAYPRDYNVNGANEFVIGRKPSESDTNGQGQTSVNFDSSSATTPNAVAQHESEIPMVKTSIILITVAKKLMKNPNTYASILGLAWSLISFRWNVQMPEIASRSIKILSDGALGMAMFSLGLFMAAQNKLFACGKAVAAFAAAMRFLVGPAVMAAMSLAVGLKGTVLHIAIVQAALPLGIVTFVFAKEYDVHPDIQSTGVIFGMLIALPITLVYYILLGL